ncbi:nucleotidyltransferase family protein [cf. Phormidesmis sp. LEGE 11477]|uniref:nucleotidyltransferase family protein n=1 Tax=cf. Phormidesmis sp. LEGE 11477 TaxID=1828680 RepID=UPI001D15A46D|nr:nucleotidyltransferase family protein [cf. Phormidesmis sp. LEGE 11477]
MLVSADKLKLLLPDGLRYVVVGGVASAHYQPARFTEDIDLMVLAEDATAVEHALQLAGWSQLGIISFGGSSWQSAEGELIDLLHAPEQSWVTAALDAPIKTLEGLQIIDLPYLIILKLSATRAVDIGDIVSMLQHAAEDETVRIRQAVETHRSDLLEDFEQFNEIARLS